MQNGAVRVTNSSTLIGKSSNVVQVHHGFQGVLVVEAASYPGLLHLQVQGSGGAWVNVNSSNIVSNQVVPLSFPAGQYRINVGSGTVTALTTVLCPTP